MRTRKKLVGLILALVVLAGTIQPTSIVWGLSDDSSQAGTSENNQTSGITIDYDGTAIHSVTDSNGDKLILYCMNDSLHWPHKTPSITNVPTYTETRFSDFFSANNITGDAQDTLKTELQNLLYAGYPYNGYGLYEVVDQAPTITEEEFNELLTPPQYLRDDFPDSLGNNTFSYSDRNDSAKLDKLNSFLKECSDYFSGKTTASGMTYQQLIQLPFYRAAYCMTNLSGDPLEAYSQIYMADYYVTEQQAYESTRDAVWSVLKSAGLKDNDNEVINNSLTDKLISADKTTPILTEEPSADKVSVTGDPTFYYSNDDQKWHTDRLSLSAPSTYRTAFKLTLPDGIKEESDKNQVRAGESFSLVSDTKPSSDVSIKLSSTVPWMDPDLKVYVADSSVKAPDGKGFQNMIGAVIHQKDIAVTASLSASTEFSFTKVWNDNNNQDGLRPSTADFASKLHLMSGDNELTGYTPEITVNSDGSWTVRYSNLQALTNDDMAYSIKEDSIDSYTSDKEEVGNGGTLTNTHTLETTTVSGTKTWEDNDNSSGNRPAGITVNLLANGETIKSTTVSPDSDGNWNYSFTDLPKYENGQEITYTVTEDAVADYSADISGYNITNSYTPGYTSLTVTKAWEDNGNQDGKRPASVQVQLYADGTASGDPVTLNADNNWTYTWEQLPERSSGTAVSYTVGELTQAPGYTTSITGSAVEGYTITNIAEKTETPDNPGTYEPETITISGTKTWDDNNNQDGRRPDSITVNLFANGCQQKSIRVQPDKDGNWNYTFSGLLKYENGKEINYTVTEDAVSGYTTEINGYNITNHYTPATTSIKVTKSWDDDNNSAGKRPDSVQVQLYADGTAYGDPVTLTSAGNWTYTWSSLPVKSNGNKIEYTVRELTEAGGYKSSVTGSAEDGFVITNTFTPTDSGGDVPDNENPSTPSTPTTPVTPGTTDNSGNGGTAEESGRETGIPSSGSGSTVPSASTSGSSNSDSASAGKSGTSSAPQTGDDMRIFLYGAVAAGSVTVLILLTAYRRRLKEEK